MLDRSRATIRYGKRRRIPSLVRRQLTLSKAEMSDKGRLSQVVFLRVCLQTRYRSVVGSCSRHTGFPEDRNSHFSKTLTKSKLFFPPHSFELDQVHVCFQSHAPCATLVITTSHATESHVIHQILRIDPRTIIKSGSRLRRI